MFKNSHEILFMRFGIKEANQETNAEMGVQKLILNAV
jgi:hypothetical protein